jgi:drug/metabolite transporter (DMT)-like permease
VSAGWLALAGALLSTAQAQLSYKLYFREKRRTHLVVAIACFVGASVCSYFALRSLTIGMVYMSTAFTQVLVVGLAHWVLGEPFTRDHGVAMALIVLGIVVYAA